MTSGAGGRFGGRSKYRAVRVEVEGIPFASKAEARRYGELLLRRRAGEISDLTLQPAWGFVINGCELRIGTRACRYTADFSYREGGVLVVEDVKGMLLPDAALRIALMRAVHGIEVRLVGRRAAGTLPVKTRVGAL